LPGEQQAQLSLKDKDKQGSAFPLTPRDRHSILAPRASPPFGMAGCSLLISMMASHICVIWAAMGQCRWVSRALPHQLAGGCRHFGCTSSTHPPAADREPQRRGRCPRVLGIWNPADELTLASSSPSGSNWPAEGAGRTRQERARTIMRRHHTMGQPSTEQAPRALELLVGEWTVEAKGPDGQAWPGEGRASFQRHPSHAHLVQRITVDVPGAPDSNSIIGCDAANGTYVQLYSDERGVCRIYTMHIDSTQWILQREGEPFAQRFIGTISNDARTISGRWEKAENGPEFTVDFYLTYRKAEP
jgi:hypothetical protein